MIEMLKWVFPLPRTHTGILLGNATMGAMIWGEGACLKITIGRSDFWDHRGGLPWQEEQNYAAIRACLEAKDEEGIRRLFRPPTESTAGQPRRPSILPVGRVDLHLGEGAKLTSGTLNLRNSEATVRYLLKDKDYSLTIHLALECQVIMVDLDGRTDVLVESVPSWRFKGDYFTSISMTPPEMVDDAGVCGWVQSLPVDPNLGVLYQQNGGMLAICTARSDATEQTLSVGKGILKRSLERGFEALRLENAAWWSAYWDEVPDVELPHAMLEELYAYGMYKLAGFSQPDGIAGTLQGPWIEEDELPPWSSDYHFNINVQMCYWPVYKSNRLEHLRPLFDLIFSWEPILRQNAKHFIGIEDGYLLPHAVDDACTCMGGFWTGCIDHACTGWVAQMMYDYARYACDETFLKEKAYPFMKGTMRVYEEMLERKDGAFILPVSVSPEYRGASMDAWGANASFQLACIHRLCENLIDAAECIGETPKPVWSEILESLPKACLSEDRKRIILWEGVELEESHRHHSHLAAIFPFDTIDIHDNTWKPIIGQSINEWIGKGMGHWSGWCIPWASMIHSRLGNGETAVLLLEIWKAVFTNEGRGTLHDTNRIGFSLVGANTWGSGAPPRRERMQLDAGMGVVAAIQDMLMHTRRGVLHLFPGVPRDWDRCRFEGMRSEGGFLISATRKDGVTTEVRIESTHAGTLRLANPWSGESLALSLQAGEVRTLTA